MSKKTNEGLFNSNGEYLIADYISFPSSSEEEIFIQKRKEYYDLFLKNNPKIIKKLIDGGLLVGEGSEGWINVAEHNIMAGVIAQKLGQLVGLSGNELEQLTYYAGTHDWNKRIEIEKAKISERKVDGITLIGWDAKIIAASESSKKGPRRATGSDLRDYKTWSITEEILRLTDSLLMPTEDMKHNKVVSIRTRCEELAARTAEKEKEVALKTGKKSSSYNKTEGEKMYGVDKDGNPYLLLTKIAEISTLIEAKIYKAISSRHPELAKKYPEQELLYQLVIDKIIEDINSMPQVISDKKI